MYNDDRDRILRSVKKSVEEAGQKPEDSAYYFVIGLSFAISVGLIIVVSNLKFKENQLEVYGQKIQNEVTIPLKKMNANDNQIKDLNSQVNALETALSKRIDFGKFVSDLIHYQFNASKWTNLIVDSDKVAISMEADNFDGLQKSLKSLEQIPSITNTSLSDVSVNPDNQKVSYTVELTVDFSRYKVNPSAK